MRVLQALFLCQVHHAPGQHGDGGCACWRCGPFLRQGHHYLVKTVTKSMVAGAEGRHYGNFTFIWPELRRRVSLLADVADGFCTILTIIILEKCARWSGGLLLLLSSPEG